MSDFNKILSTAQKRGENLGLAYAGALTPEEAHQLHSEGEAALVDVRTIAEITYVGRVPEALILEWQLFPTMEVNSDFASTLKQQVDNQKPVLFICRSGIRSHFAAALAAEQGYQAYNVLEGFEGDLDTHKHRNTTNGWRAKGLPWIQS